MSLKLRINPFTSRPLNDPKIFAGREQEIYRIVNSLYQTANNNAEHVFVTGERGIGKSSYTEQIELIATGDQTLINRFNIDTDGKVFNFIVCKHICTEGNTFEQIIQSLVSSIIEKTSRFSKLTKKLQELSISLELNLGVIKTTAGAKQSFEQANPELINRFSSFLKELSFGKANFTDGFIIIIDELDKVINSSNFGSFFKSLTETISNKGVLDVSLVLVGINGTMEILQNQHASVRRIFEEIEIPLMSPEERKEVVRNALSQTNTQIMESVLNEISNISSGFPAPIHVVGKSVFDVDTDNIIDHTDFHNALSKIVNHVKKTELRDQLLGAGSGRYQQILKIMADYPLDNVPSSYINEKLGLDQPNVSPYLGNLNKNEIIVRVDRGVYKIKDKLLKIYIQKVAVLEDQDFTPDSDNDEIL